MNFLRKLTIGLGTPVFTILVFVAVILTSINMAFHTPVNIKKWLNSSDIYSNAVNAFIDQISKDNSQSGGLSLSQPEVQTAFKTVVTPAFLQKNTETVIDGSYAWLQSKTTKPIYNIDLTPIKTAFADALENSARARLATLPTCSYRNQPATTDPFSVTCNPPASVVNADIAQIRNEIISGQFLPQAAITADTTTLGDPNKADQTTTTATPQKPAQPWYQQATSAPAVYKWSYYAPMIFGVLAVLTAVGIVFSARTRRTGLKIVASCMLAAGALLALASGASLFTLNQLTKTITPENSSTSLQDPALNVAQFAGSYIARIQLLSGITLAAIGVVTLIILYITRPKIPKPAQTTATTNKI